jgi:hypothetical protein
MTLKYSIKGKNSLQHYYTEGMVVHIWLISYHTGTQMVNPYSPGTQMVISYGTEAQILNFLQYWSTESYFGINAYSDKIS